MPLATRGFSLLIALGLVASAAHAQTRGQAGSPPIKLAQSMNGAAPPAASKAQFIKQFQQLDDEYSALKLKTAKYRPLQPSASQALRQARSDVSTRMAAAESLLKAGRNKLDSIGDQESKIGQIQEAIKQTNEELQKLEALTKKLSDTGQALVALVGSDADSEKPPRRKP
jgi:chromosome segregation ATPase